MPRAVPILTKFQQFITLRKCGATSGIAPGDALFADSFEYSDQVISEILLRIPLGKLKSWRIFSSSLRVYFIAVAIVLPAEINFTVLSRREEKSRK
ncbi:hypothetical protein DK872_05160 [Kosakonia sp. MH5]|nr:hypothetical protein [Kosakonia sp. MH5]